MGFTKNQNAIDATEEVTTNIEKVLQAAKHFSPAYDRVLIKPELSSMERRTKKSGIILADETKDSYQSAEGYLVGYGPTAREEAKKLLGKRILFSKYTGDTITVPLPDGTVEKFVLGTDGDIYGELK